LTVTVTVFIITYAQSPTMQPARALGQFIASAGIGVVVFLVTYGVGALMARTKK